jgi:hypothetical protein
VTYRVHGNRGRQTLAGPPSASTWPSIVTIAAIAFIAANCGGEGNGRQLPRSEPAPTSSQPDQPRVLKEGERARATVVRQPAAVSAGQGFWTARVKLTDRTLGSGSDQSLVDISFHQDEAKCRRSGQTAPIGQTVVGKALTFLMSSSNVQDKYPAGLSARELLVDDC